MKNYVRAGLTAAMVAAAALTIPAGAAQAGDDLCNVHQDTWVKSSTDAWEPMYIIPAGGGFRLEGYTLGYWIGHGNGRETGYIKDDGRLRNC
jgi:hypothetical protein